VYKKQAHSNQEKSDIGSCSFQDKQQVTKQIANAMIKRQGVSISVLTTVD
jgi:hypothetical protein